MKKILIIPFHISKSIDDANYLSEGIVEELIDFIAELGTFKVLGRNLSLFLQQNPKPGKELVSEFGIDYLIEGSVKQSHDGEVQLVVRLINAIDEHIIATRKNTITLEEWTGALQALAIGLLQIEQPIVAQTGRLVPKKNVREIYLKGLYHWNRYTYEEMKKAISLYRQAIKEDEYYAPAYAGIADCYSVIAVMGYEPSAPAFAKSLTNINKALALNDKHSGSYLAASFINLFCEMDYEKAKINLDFALGLNRNNPHVYLRLSFYYAYKTDFHLAEKHCLTAIKLDPLSIPQYVMLIRLSIYQRNYQKAMELIDATLMIDEGAVPLLELKGMVYLLLGNIESAISTYRICLEQSSENGLNYAFLSYSLASSGFLIESKEVEDKLDGVAFGKETGNYDYAKAIIKLGRNDIDGFFQHLHRSMDLGLTSLVGDIYSNPIYSEIRKDHRYQVFLKWCNLEVKNPLLEKVRRPIHQLTIQSNTKESLIIDPQDIAYVKGEGNYSTIYWYEKSILYHHFLRITLKQVEKCFMPYDYLLRVHKSYIINLDEDLQLKGNAKGYFLESVYFPIRIPVSRTLNERVKMLFIHRK